MKRNVALVLPTALIVVAGLIACGVGSTGSAVRPKDPTAAEALSESCPVVADYGQPLIVDWKPHQRANLEEAMSAGVAVVAYDCHSLHLVSDCRIDGTYGTLGISRKEDVVELENADEIRANLPTFGSKLAVEFKGEIERGSTINLAMVMVGKRRTTVSSAARAQLRGTCDGATHFIRGAYMGAFAMGTGTRGRVSAAAQLFGADTSANSVSTKNVRSKDGDPNACAEVQPGASSLPGGCSAILRLELAPVAAEARVLAARPSEKAESEQPPDPSCPRGLVLSGGKCSQPNVTQPHDCTLGSASECATECDKGSAMSCFKLGVMFHTGIGVARDPAKALAPYRKACDGGEAKACSNLGVQYAKGEGVARDPAQALPLYRRACDADGGIGCSNLGALYEHGMGVPTDLTLAASLYQRACFAGVAGGCSNLGRLNLNGEGLAKDAAAVALYRKTCNGGSAIGCQFLGSLYAKGAGVPKDLVQAAALFRKACDGGVPPGCRNLGDAYTTGAGVAADVTAALRAYHRGCDGGDGESCRQVLNRGEEP